MPFGIQMTPIPSISDTEKEIICNQFDKVISAFGLTKISDAGFHLVTSNSER
jgi:hypothetical protein